MANPRPIFGVFDEREGTYKYLMKSGMFESRNTADFNEVLLLNELQASFTCFFLNQAVNEGAGADEYVFNYMQMHC